MFENLNSPIQKVDLFPFKQLFVKRDDLIDPYISGNKWRKLKYILKKAEELNKTHLITFGGAFSNHLVATAALSSRIKFKTTAFVRGEEVTNQMLLLCKLYGMNLIFTDRESYKNKTKLFDDYFANDKNAFFVDEGGACLEATVGCAEIIDELEDTYDHIFCAAGTGTTASGLLNGIQKHKLNTKLHIVPALKGGDFILDEMQKYSTVSDQLVLHTDYHFGGYAKTTPELIEFIKDFVSKTGILIDPVYTAKMFYAIKDLQQKQIINKEDKILTIHTGGLLGLLGMMNKF